MADPTYVTSAVGDASTSATGVAVTLPAGVAANDTLVAVHASGLANTLTGPAGWTLLQTKTTSSEASALYVRVAQAGDASSSVTFTTSTSAKQAVVVGVWRGADTTTPVGGSASLSYTTTGTTRTAPAVTAANGPVIEACVTKGTDPTAVVPPTGYTLRAEVHQASTGAVALGLAGSTTDLDGGGDWATASLAQAATYALWLNPAPVTYVWYRKRSDGTVTPLVAQRAV